MTAQVYIVLNSAKNALLVPSSALSSKQFSGQRKQGQSADKLDPQKRSSPPNRELWAQGAGNIVSGLIGGMPVTSVIVRIF